MNITTGKVKDEREIINVYCDESCHLENSLDNVMVLGAVYCPKDEKARICKEIAQIKRKYNVKPKTELKWSKISRQKEELYEQLIIYFFSENSLCFRGLVADKTKLNHKKYNQTHDQWYYKMYFYTLNYIFSPKKQYCVYIDIKDTHSAEKISKLHEVICNSNYDFSHTIIKKMRAIRSDEVQIMQITDILIGAINYANNNKYISSSKVSIVDLVRRLSGQSLTGSTFYTERKFNLFVWEPDYYGQ